MKKPILLASLLLMASVTANAHPGHGLAAGFGAGLLHPLTGWDHLLVMLALGIWAARRPAAQGWQLPVLFVVVMTVSASLAVAWLPVALAETLVAVSVGVMGLLLIGRVNLSRALQLGIVSVAAVAHGYLHGMELGLEVGLELGSHWSGLAGMVLATLLLHALGWLLGRQTQPQLLKLTRCLGGVMFGLGTYALMF